MIFTLLFAMFALLSLFTVIEMTSGQSLTMEGIARFRLYPVSRFAAWRRAELAVQLHKLQGPLPVADDNKKVVAK